MIRPNDKLLVAASEQATGALYRLAAVAPRPRYVPDERTIPGKPAIAYLTAAPDAPFASVFPELVALLGKGKVETLAVGSVAAPNQRLVLGPGAALGSRLPGNRIVALGPQPDLEKLLGLGAERQVVMQKCVLASDAPELSLLSGSALQLPVEGTLSAYAEVGQSGQVLATLRCSDGEYPALYRLPRVGAQPAFMFTFSLPAALVRTRQGDPALRGKEVDGIEGARPSDLFARDLTAAQLSMPFADLLMEAALELVEGPQPSLRFWHNPAGKRGVFIITSDQDFVSEARMAIMLATLVDWKVPATFYLTSGTYQSKGPARLTEPSAPFVTRALELGVSFGAHTWLKEAGRPPLEIIKEHAALLKSGYQLRALSARFHIVAWPGYEEPARDLAAAGYRYDASYLTLNSQHIDGLGYMTGSGLPLHFHTPEGARLDIRQLATQLDDHPHPVNDTGLRDASGRSLQMTLEKFRTTTRSVLEAAGRHYHSPIVVNNHPLQFVDDPTWMRMLVECARLERLAILDVERYDTFVQALLDSAVHAAADPNTFHVLVQAPEQDLIVRNYAGDSISVDGEKAQLRATRLFDRPEKILTLARGPHEIVLQ